MPGLNIEMIRKSFSNCSLGGRNLGVWSPTVRSPLPQLRSGEVTVEFNSEVALPCHWEQCLDMRMGEIYYRNWITGQRTTVDPRLASIDNHSSTSFSSDGDISSDDDDSSNEGERDNYFSTGDSSSSNSSSASSAAYTLPEVTSCDPQVLVAAGCKSCFMYFMVPKQDSECPKCGRLLLHLGRNSGCM